MGKYIPQINYINHGEYNYYMTELEGHMKRPSNFSRKHEQQGFLKQGRLNASLGM